MRSYHLLLEDVLANGEHHEDRTGVGTLSVFGRQWRHDMRSGFPLLTTKYVPLRWVFEELSWFLSGSTDENDLRKRGVDIWKEWATEEQCAKFGRSKGDLGHVYGGLWRNFLNVDDRTSSPGNDQIRSLLKEITVNPNSRRLIVTGWHPTEQFNVALPPCHTLWQVKCHGERDISLSLYARSIDIFLGLPFNIASYAMLLMMLAHVTRRQPRELIFSFGDLHLYKNHISQAKFQLGRVPFALPNVKINRHWQSDDPLANLLAIQWMHIEVINYQHHPKIDAEVAI